MAASLLTDGASDLAVRGAGGKAGPDPDDFERSVGVLVHDMGTAPGFAARFVNVHTGSHRGAGVAAGRRTTASPRGVP